ncbi:MAG: PDZ domain-containing protein [Verrucomicrobia bacterium]|nr:PDZ domain-containing protein [Verrucomicrobiota bacterium]
MPARHRTRLSAGLASLLTMGLCASVHGASILIDEDTAVVAYLGVRADEPGDGDPSQHDTQPGLIITHVDAAGPAAAVLKTHDRLVSVNGQLLFNPAQLSALIATLAPGDIATVSARRQGEPITTTVTLGQRVYVAPRPTDWPTTTPVPAQAPKAWTVETNIETRVGVSPIPVEHLLDDIRSSYRESIPDAAFDTNEMERFIQNVRDRLVEAYDHPVAARNAFQPSAATAEHTWAADQINEFEATSFKDASTTATLSIQDGVTTFMLEDNQGNIIFSGPIDTPDERRRLPGEALKYLDRMQSPVTDENDDSWMY